jgi:hypothetical protein
MFERFQPLSKLRERETCPHCEMPAQKVFLKPAATVNDTPGYRSPIDGTWIEGRVQRREDLRRNGCIAWEPGMKEDFDRKRSEENTRFDRSLENSIEAEIQALPVRKRERLEAEVHAGASAEVVRQTPH